MPNMRPGAEALLHHRDLQSEVQQQLEREQAQNMRLRQELVRPGTRPLPSPWHLTHVAGVASFRRQSSTRKTDCADPIPGPEESRGTRSRGGAHDSLLWGHEGSAHSNA